MWPAPADADRISSRLNASPRPRGVVRDPVPQVAPARIELELLHLAARLLQSPAFDPDPVGRAHRARAVLAAPAMEVHRLADRVGHDLEETPDVLGLGRV